VAALPGALTTVDAFLGGEIEIEQPAKGYRAGLDAVLLAAAARPVRPVCEPLRVVDVGAGVGTAGLCLAARLGEADVTLVERDALASRLASRNIERNRLGARARVATIDVMRPAPDAGKQGLPDASFDLAISNPPYLAEGRHRPSADDLKAAAHAMPEDGLDRWLRFMARMTRPGGTAVIIHRADCLAALLAALDRRFGDVMVLPLHPRAGEPASRVLVRAVKASRAPLRIAQGLVLHDKEGSFRPDIKAVLSAPRALEWPRAGLPPG
jgi:tRNA1(Val) A37 N6-methylase TrmN6